jgi:hypothetical protein
LPTQGEAKGLDTIGKRTQLKFRRKELPNALMQAPLNKCISPNFSSLDAKLLLETRIGYFPPLVGNA